MCENYLKVSNFNREDLPMMLCGMQVFLLQLTPVPVLGKIDAIGMRDSEMDLTLKPSILMTLHWIQHYIF